MSKKRTKKEAGASPSAQTEGGAPALLWKSVQNSLSAPLKLEGEDYMRNHKSGSRKSRHRRFFSPFSTPIATLFRAYGLVMGTGGEHRPKVLLVGIDTPLVSPPCDPLPFAHALSHIRTSVGSPISGPPSLTLGIRCNGMDCFVPSRSPRLEELPIWKSLYDWQLAPLCSPYISWLTREV